MPKVAAAAYADSSCGIYRTEHEGSIPAGQMLRWPDTARTQADHKRVGE